MSGRPSEDVGARLKAVAAGSSENAGAASLITAGGTGDATEVTGQTVDRMQGLGQSKGMADSCVLLIPFLATLADTETISFSIDRQYSDDDASWDTAVEVQAATVAATSSGGTDEHGVVELDQDLSAGKRYVRYNVTPDLSAGSIDTALFSAVVVLGGFDNMAQ